MDNKKDNSNLPNGILPLTDEEAIKEIDLGKFLDQSGASAPIFDGFHEDIARKKSSIESELDSLYASILSSGRSTIVPRSFSELTADEPTTIRPAAAAAPAAPDAPLDTLWMNPEDYMDLPASPAEEAPADTATPAEAVFEPEAVTRPSGDTLDAAKDDIFSLIDDLKSGLTADLGFGSLRKQIEADPGVAPIQDLAAAAPAPAPEAPAPAPGDLPISKRPIRTQAMIDMLPKTDDAPFGEPINEPAGPVIPQSASPAQTPATPFFSQSFAPINEPAGPVIPHAAPAEEAAPVELELDLDAFFAPAPAETPAAPAEEAPAAPIPAAPAAPAAPIPAAPAVKKRSWDEISMDHIDLNELDLDELVGEAPEAPAEAEAAPAAEPMPEVVELSFDFDTPAPAETAPAEAPAEAPAPADEAPALEELEAFSESEIDALLADTDWTDEEAPAEEAPAAQPAELPAEEPADAMPETPVEAPDEAPAEDAEAPEVLFEGSAPLPETPEALPAAQAETPAVKAPNLAPIDFEIDLDAAPQAPAEAPADENDFVFEAEILPAAAAPAEPETPAAPMPAAEAAPQAGDFESELTALLGDAAAAPVESAAPAAAPIAAAAPDYQQRVIDAIRAEDRPLVITAHDDDETFEDPEATKTRRQKKAEKKAAKKKGGVGEVIRKIVLTLSILTIIGSLGFLANTYLIEPLRFKNDSAAVAEQLIADHNVHGDSTEVDANVKADNPDVEFPEGMLAKYARLYAANSDLRGWISIPKFEINLPITQGKDNDYYLHRNVYAKRTDYGVPFFDYRMTNFRTLHRNTVVYGHNMRHDDLIFGMLENYREISGFVDAPVIECNTIYGDFTWFVYAVFITNSAPSQDNGYLFPYNFIDVGDAKFEEYIKEIDKRKFYTTGVDINKDDKILTLSTCCYDFDGARLVVVARLRREGESVTVDTSRAVMNQNPKYPQAWYNANKKSNPYEADARW